MDGEVELSSESSLNIPHILVITCDIVCYELGLVGDYDGSKHTVSLDMSRRCIKDRVSMKDSGPLSRLLSQGSHWHNHLQGSGRRVRLHV